MKFFPLYIIIKMGINYSLRDSGFAYIGNKNRYIKIASSIENLGRRG